MDHPGVKSLLDRILRQQKPTAPPINEQEKQITLKKFNEIEFDNPVKQVTSFTRLTDFKDNLKLRMKARRCQIRKEEEEDDQMDEEYQIKEGINDKEDDESDELSNNNKETKNISDDDDDDNEEEKEDDADDSGDSDSNFKLNLNDEEDEENEDSKKKTKKSSTTSTKSNKISCYDFDEEDDDELPDLNIKKKDKEIPLTNSIPSNQLTKDNLLKCNYNEFNTLSQDDPDRLFLEGTQFLVANKQRRSLDELTNISFNYETASNHTNTNHHTPNTTTTSTTQNGSTGKDIGKSGDNTLNDEVLFDELAMLCSGQFRQGANTQKKDATQIKEKASQSVNDDLYAADDGEDYDNVMRSKVLFNDENSSSNDSVGTTDKNGRIEEESKSSHEEVEIEKKEEEEKIETKKDKVKKIKKVEEEEEEEEEEELDENKEENLDDILGDEESNENKEESKDQKSDEEDEDNKGGFIEEEAELSGSEEEDEDYDGNSEDDKGLIFSGDEDELPSDSELKQQLGKFYLKDQMDEDKRQIRMFKEMYLADGEMHSKEARRKQFRWKNIDDTWGHNHHHSSSEEEDEEEEATDDPEENNDLKKKKSEERANKYAKLIESRNWRLNRHEREQFVHAKSKTETLLSDDEDQSKKKNNEDDDDEEENSNDYSDDENTKMSTASTGSSSANQLFKKGQLLLKQSLLNKCDQNKRTLNGEISNITRSVENSKSDKQSATQQQNKETVEKADLLKKFSFLNRDKSYLSRLSNYVNKNFSGSPGQHMSIGNAGGDFSGSVKPVSCIKSRTNNMVFSTFENSANSDETSLKTAASNRKQSEDQQKPSIASNSSSPIVVSSLPKRTKYDTCESIFNHIS